MNQKKISYTKTPINTSNNEKKPPNYTNNPKYIEKNKEKIYINNVLKLKIDDDKKTDLIHNMMSIVSNHGSLSIDSIINKNENENKILYNTEKSNLGQLLNFLFTICMFCPKVIYKTASIMMSIFLRLCLFILCAIVCVYTINMVAIFFK